MVNYGTVAYDEIMMCLKIMASNTIIHCLFVSHLTHNSVTGEVKPHNLYTKHLPVSDVRINDRLVDTVSQFTHLVNIWNFRSLAYTLSRNTLHTL